MAGAVLENTPRELPRFKPEKLAQLEFRALHNLYLGRKTRGRDFLVQMMQHQYGINPFSALSAIGHLLKAYSLADYHLEKSEEYLQYYKILSRAAGLGFDPNKAARAQMNLDGHREWSGSTLQRETIVEMESYLLGTIYNVPKESLLAAAQIREEAYSDFREYLLFIDPDVARDELHGDPKDLMQHAITGLTKYYELLSVAIGQRSLQVT